MEATIVAIELAPRLGARRGSGCGVLLLFFLPKGWGGKERTQNVTFFLINNDGWWDGKSKMLVQVY